MLTDEQKQAIASRLHGETQEPAESKVDAAPQADGDQTQQAETQTPPSADKSGDGTSEKVEQPNTADTARQEPQHVPVDKYVKLRHERNDLRKQLQEANERNARLEGYVKGSVGKSPDAPKTDGDKDWLDDLIEQVRAGTNSSTTPGKDPVAERLERVEAVIQQQEAQANRSFLNDVVTKCQERDPTVPREFLVDRFAEGATPEQALQRWAQWVTPLRSNGTQGASAPKPEVRAPAPPPPPTVNRAPQGPNNTKPTTWRDVQAAVRHAIVGR